MKVFLSHSSLDRAFIDAYVLPCLAAIGAEVFYSSDADDAPIRGGEDWDARLQRELAASNLFVVVVSANAARPESYVKDEVGLWLADHPTAEGMIPVVIDATEPRRIQVRLHRLNYLDFSRPDDRAARALVTALQAAVPVAATGSPGATSTPVTVRTQIPRIALVIGVLAALLAVGAAVIVATRGGGPNPATATAPTPSAGPATSTSAAPAPTARPPTIDGVRAAGSSFSFTWSDPNPGSEYLPTYQVFVAGEPALATPFDTDASGIPVREQFVSEVETKTGIVPIDTDTTQYCVVVRLITDTGPVDSVSRCTPNV